MDRIPVGISACLTGAQVRHDGGHKRSSYCSDVLSEYFELVPMCPEQGAGFGTPRPAMHLVDVEGEQRLQINRSGEDVTDRLRDWVDRRVPELDVLRGFILMGKSPSCGMERIRVYGSNGEVLRRDAQGIFAERLIKAWPMLPVEESGRLQDPVLRENFIERVYLYDQWCRMRESGLTAAALIRFHTEHKFQLLAHCQATYRKLGPMLSDLRRQPLEQLADDYICAFMQGMTKRISRGSHANVMLHMLGFFRGKIDAQDREALQASIDDYLQGVVPLIVPMTLLRLASRKHPDAYLSRQRYLVPYPDALGLRNQV